MQLHIIVFSCITTFFYDIGCSVNVTEDVGTISSPGYPNRTYSNNLNCQWKIQRSNISQNVTFYLHTLQLEYGRDVLSAEDTSGIQLATISGNSSNAIFFTSAANELLLSFISDDQTRYDGFHLSFSIGIVPLEIINDLDSRFQQNFHF